MSFHTYLIRRIVGTLVVFLAVATIIFFMFRMIGDPIGMHISPHMSPEQLERVEEGFGLHEPLYVQYYKYIISIFSLDWGLSFYYMEPTETIVLERLFNSLLLTIPSVIIAYIGGILGGVFMGWKRGTNSERLGLTLALLFRSTPRFFVGILLIFIFGVYLALFPFGGMLSPGKSLDSPLHLLIMPDFYWHAVLPIASLTFYIMGIPLLLMRTSMLEIINEEFVNVVRAKGATERRVMYNHVARNAMLPVTTAFGVSLGFSFGGNVLVETVFSYPGIGRLMVDSVFNSDFPVAQFSFLIMTASILLMNLIVDFTYVFLDPRVEYD